MKFELTKEYSEWLEEAVANDNKEAIAESMADAYPADISTILYEFNTEDSKYIVDLLDKEAGAEIISNLEPDIRKRFLRVFSSAEIASFMDYVDSDDAADILNEQPVIIREEVIALMGNQEKASNIVDLLRYEPHCAGGLMAKELIKANVNWTVVQCIDEIRRQGEKVEKIYSVYVVDRQGVLIGRVSLKKIILARNDTRIADIYEPDIISVETFREDVEVAEIMQKYDLEAIPVVNVQGRLLGRITIDDVVDVITEQAETERQLMSGLSESIEEDDTVWMLSRARLPWLLIGMVGGMLGAEFIGLFEDDLRIIPTLAIFIPLITATGGNVGIQSSSLVLQSLSYKSAFEQSIMQRILKTLLVGIINGLVISSIVFAAALLLGKPLTLAAIVGIALFSVVLLSSLMGTLTPLALDKIGINPALAAGPFITTANDLIGLAVYFSVAHLLYNTI
jgi:magnesium transporter